MAAGDITKELIARVWELAGDLPEFNETRILHWLNDAQDKFLFVALDMGMATNRVSPTNLIAERMPDLTKQLSQTLDSSGQYAVPADFLYRWRFFYGATYIEAAYRNATQIAIAQRDTSWGTYAATAPVYTITTAGKLQGYPVAAVTFKFDYVKRPITMTTSIDTDLPARFHEPLVIQAAARGCERHGDVARYQLLMAEYAGAVSWLLGGGVK